jgi:hypothetical protein
MFIVRRIDVTYPASPYSYSSHDFAKEEFV